MYSLVALALALSDTSKVDTVKFHEAPKVTFSHVGHLSMPSAPVMVAITTKGANNPERYTTCYEVRNGSCWSETSTEYFKGF